MTDFKPVYGDGVFLAGDGYIAPLAGDRVPNALEVMAWPSMTEPCGEETLPWSKTWTPDGVVLRFPPWLIFLIGAQYSVSTILLLVRVWGIKTYSPTAIIRK